VVFSDGTDVRLDEGMGFCEDEVEEEVDDSVLVFILLVVYRFKLYKYSFITVFFWICNVTLATVTFFRRGLSLFFFWFLGLEIYICWEIKQTKSMIFVI